MNFLKLHAQNERLIMRLFFVFGVLLLMVVLTKYYQIFSPLFAYLGLRFMPQNELTQVMVGAVVLLIAAFFPLNYKKPSNIFLLLLYIMSYLPVAVIFTMDKMASFYGFVSYTLFMFLLVVHDGVNLSSRKVKIRSLTQKSFSILLFSMLGAGLLILVSHYGLALNVKNYDAIYDARAVFKEQTGGNRLYVFSFTWMANVLVMVLLTISVVKKKWTYVILGLLMQLYLFNLGGNKSIFMLPFLLFFIIFATKFCKQYAPVVILYSFVFMCLGLYFFDFVMNDHFSLASSIFVRRNFFVPANLFYYYLEFFENQPPDFFAQSFPFSLFMESNFERDIPHIIGETYIRKGTHANANFLADLFYNFKWLGFIIGFTVILLYSKVVDFIAQQKNYLVVLPLAALPVISLMNSGLIVNLVSFGLLLMVTILALYPNSKYYYTK